MATPTNPFNYLSVLLNPAAFAGQQAANPGLWNIRPELFGTTEGPQQQPQQPFDFVGMTNAQNQGQLDRIKAIGELQAQEQARKDSNNQALINQKASQPGAAWGPNGIFSLPGNVAAVAADRQQRADEWNQVPTWAKMDSLLTPQGMKNAVGVSQVQNPFNANPQQAQAGVSYAPIMEQQRQDAGGFANNQVGQGAWNTAGSLVGYSDLGNAAASPEMAKSMQQANAPFANWQGLLNQSNQDLANPAFKNLFASLLSRR